jgi:23S rRNA (adenine2503-C2)-methyltransferase
MSDIIFKTPERAAEIETGDARRNLVGLTRAELVEAFAAHGLEKMRASQVWGWMYKRGITSFDAMTNINKQGRDLLSEHFVIGRAGIAKDAVSFDDTRKWLVTFPDGNEVETVYIPDGDRGTLCISSQVGCTLACTFCHTGTQRLVRNLTAGDIVTQFLIAKDGLNDWTPQGQRNNEDRKITNIVFMGMGEPLMNYEHVIQAIKILSDNEGLALSRRKITVSTSGVVPFIEKLGQDVGCSLAISLHAVTDALRNEIVPINRKYPIAQLLEACRNYPELSNARRIMFEYVMLKGVNDSDEDARALVQLLKDIPSKVNLIPFNPWPGAPYECSSNNRIHSFGRILIAGGIAAPIRKTRGQDILAACGQLKSASELKKGQKVKLK